MYIYISQSVSMLITSRTLVQLRALRGSAAKRVDRPTLSVVGLSIVHHQAAIAKLFLPNGRNSSDPACFPIVAYADVALRPNLVFYVSA